MIIKWIPFRYFYTYLLLFLGPLIIPALLAAGAALCIPFYMLYICCCEIRGFKKLFIPLAWIGGSIGLYVALCLAIALSPIVLIPYYLVFFTLTCLLLFE